MITDNDRILDLVRKTQVGDEVAFALLYDEFAQRIYAFIRIKVITQEQAEDIMQDVFLKAWTGCKTLNLNNLNFSAWLYKVAANTVNDYYRKKYREPLTNPLEDGAEIAGIDSPENNTSDKIQKHVVEETLDKLPLHYKEVIELRFMQDFSVIETARIMGRNAVTVRVWQHRAIKHLEQLFKKYGQSSEEIL
jgi:RNA polymerase sigma-70 factor, ECF subfamily